ncbi:MAG: Anaphase-promoting complex subunit 23 [Sclerophora amabilis]|nr:MAG: Anaphase-promoting complex subunit 23 [Sclerophora amabilis]
MVFVYVNGKDHPATYGLGQAYEALRKEYNALSSYQGAAALHPQDPTMWDAVEKRSQQMDKPLKFIGALFNALVAETGDE